MLGYVFRDKQLDSLSLDELREHRKALLSDELPKEEHSRATSKPTYDKKLREYIKQREQNELSDVLVTELDDILPVSDTDSQAVDQMDFIDITEPDNDSLLADQLKESPLLVGRLIDQRDMYKQQLEEASELIKRLLEASGK